MYFVVKKTDFESKWSKRLRTCSSKALFLLLLENLIIGFKLFPTD